MATSSNTTNRSAVECFVSFSKGRSQRISIQTHATNVINKNPQFKPVITWSSDFILTNALNLGYLSSFVYWNRNILKRALNDIYEKGERSFTFEKTAIKSPFLLPTQDDYPLSDVDHFIFKDTAEGSIVKALIGTNTQVALFNDEKQVYIAVRGTEGFSWPNGIRDWITNAQAVAVDFKEGKGKVHDGFYKSFTSVKQDINDFFGKNDRKKKKVVVTGHSLGGAVATLIAAYTAEKIGCDVMLYTFGSPRVGDADFVKHYSQSGKIHAWRLFNVCDVVPLVPTKHTNIALPLLITAMSTPFPVAYIASLSLYDLSPFTHFGVPVALKKTKSGGVMLVDPKVPPPFELFSSREGDDYKTKWTELAGRTIATASALPNLVFLALSIKSNELFRILGDAIVTAHIMPTYLDIIGPVLRQWAKAYVDSEQLSRDPANAKHLEERIQALQETENKLMMENMREEAIAPPDATSTASTPMTTADKIKITRETLTAMQSQKTEMEASLLRLKNPEALARFICGEKITAPIKKEIDYHAALK